MAGQNHDRPAQREKIRQARAPLSNRRFSSASGVP
jgi:hypothetical protein